MTDQHAPSDEKPILAANDLISAARTLRNGGNKEAAAAIYLNLREEFFDRIEGFIEGGDLLLEDGKFDAAEACFAKAVDGFPESWIPHQGLARTSTYRRDWVQAIARWQAFRERFPDRVEGYHGLGIALRNAGEFVAADQIHNAGLSAFPEDYWLAWGHAQTAQYQSDWKEALLRWRSVQDRFPNELSGYTGAAEALRQMGRLEEARDVVTRVSSLSPESPELRKQVAATLLSEGLYNKAISAVADLRRDYPSRRDVDVGPSVHGVLISQSPVIILAGAWSFESIVHPTMAYYEQFDEPIYFLMISVYSIVIDPKFRDRYVAEAKTLRERFPHANITFLANDVLELTEARKAGLQADLLNNNAFVDENVYKIITNRPKEFDAVYNARFIPYKRHFLASGINSLVLIVANQSPDVMVRLRKLLPHSVSSPFLLSIDKVVDTLNSAKCGLCLSDKEGAMYASTEYLMCGLPVITTKNIGGRDWFFDDSYVSYAEDTTDSVASCVLKLCANLPAPEFVRENILQRVRRERAVFFDMVERIFDTHGQGGRRYEPEFRKSFWDKWNYHAPPLTALLAPR